VPPAVDGVLVWVGSTPILFAWVIPAGGISAGLIAVDSNAGAFRLSGGPAVAALDSGKVLSKGLAATLSAGSADDEPHPASSFLGDGASCATRASSGEAGDAARSGGASNKKPTPKNTPTGAIATTLRERRRSENTRSCLVTARIVELPGSSIVIRRRERFMRLFSLT